MGCDIHDVIEAKRDGNWEAVVKLPYVDRNYGLFALLAGVRNDNGYTPIAEPKGIPGDGSDYTWELLGEDDIHGCSWLTLDELSSFNWDQRLKVSGVLSEDQYLALIDNADQPTSWSKWIVGPDIVVVTPQQYREGGFTPEQRIYVSTVWERTAKEIVGSDFLDGVVGRMWNIMDNPDSTYDDVRYVFGFDN